MTIHEGDSGGDIAKTTIPQTERVQDLTQEYLNQGQASTVVRRDVRVTYDS